MGANKRFICIHGHFYQPPRENPWLETVETQDSAAPYHDWNERICAECYATNGAARIVNSKNQITRIVNNYARISFNFGPTLLSWLMENAPRTYRMILDGERRSRKAFKGHSSAMAQVYNHIILPLASRRDRITQIRWGIADYQYHYGATPEGMWLAETAADNESLELLAQHGIKFTVLAPHQCKRIRRMKEGGGWTDTSNATVDTTRPYLVRFGSGARLPSFSMTAQPRGPSPLKGCSTPARVLPEGSRAASNTTPIRNWSTSPPTANPTATITNTARWRWPMRCSLLEEDPTVNLTNYGSFLEQFPPEYEAEIVENTSWSCVHGVERWRSDCGCNGGKAGWNQAWRAPLRKALDELRDALVPLTEAEGAKLFKDVWEARDGYIEVVLDHSPQTVERFLRRHQTHALTVPERVRALELMEMQRHAQLMYTSCGWFFDDISGIETVQIIAYAARVLQLAQEALRRAGRAAGAGFSGPSGRGPLQRRRGRRRRANLQGAGRHQAAGTGAGGGALRHQLGLLLLCRGDRPFLLPRPAQLLRHVHLRPGTARRWAGSRLPAPSPASSRASPSPFCTSATRTSPPPSKPMQPKDAAAFEAFAAAGRRARAARRLSRSDSPARPLLRPAWTTRSPRSSPTSSGALCS